MSSELRPTNPTPRRTAARPYENGKVNLDYASPGATKGMPPLPRDPPMPPAPRKRFNAIGIMLAFVVAAITLPFTMRFQSSRYGASAHNAWRMANLDNVTEKEAIKRFGQPLARHDFSLNNGSLAGPEVGQKKFYAFKAPDYQQRVAEAAEVWSYPRFSAIREDIWKLPDSYLTIWFHEPRSQIDLSTMGKDDVASIILPDTAQGDWVAVDNYRVGNDLVKINPGGPAGR